MEGFASMQHGAILLQSIDDAEQLFLHGGVVALRRGELAAVENNQAAILADDATELVVTGVGVDVKRLGEVRIGEHSLAGEGLLDGVESLALLFAPDEFLCGGRDASERFHGVRSVGYESFVVVGEADEGSELFGSLRFGERKKSRDLLGLWLDSTAVEGETKVLDRRSGEESFFDMCV